MSTQDTHTATGSQPNWFLRALQQTLPVILGYLPVGFAYGVLAQKSGLSAANTMLMSLLVLPARPSSSLWDSWPPEPARPQSF